MASERFETVVGTQRAGTFLEVPLDVPAVFGRVRAPVRVTVNGHTWRTTVMRYGERYYLPLNRENRGAAGVAAGDTVSVLVESDHAPRTVDVPADLAAALDAAPGAREAFDAPRKPGAPRAQERRSTRRRSRTAVNGLSGWRRPSGPRLARGGWRGSWSRCSRGFGEALGRGAAFARRSCDDTRVSVALRSVAARGCA